MTDPFRAAPSTIAGDALVPHVGLLLATLEGRITPRRWLAAGFGRRVEDARLHLRPIVAAELLEQSFAREANRSEPIRLAYAVRYVELSEQRSLPEWRDLIPDS